MKPALFGAAAVVLAAALMWILRPAPPRSAAEPLPPFVDATSASGIRFTPGLPSGTLSIRDTAGSGCGLVDYDRDGHLDAVLLGWDHCALWHNETGGRFREVTAGSGLPQKGQWIGCSSADYDGDGWPDLLLTGYGCLALLRNEGGERFRDVTRADGLEQPSGFPLFAAGSAWGDYDRDGRPDLYVVRYVRFKEGMQELCRSRAGSLETCNPDHYAAQKGTLYRNVDGQRFADVTQASGAAEVHGKGWSALFFDYDQDGWIDLYIANDEMPGDLLRNEGGRRFRNVGVDAGVAFDADGRPHGAMGSDAGDYDRDGRPDLVVTTFTNEPFSLYRSNGDGSFTDRAALSGLGIATQPQVGWAARFLDYDRDGWPDLFFLNGQATDSERYAGDRGRLRQPVQLFRNGGGSFAPVPLSLPDMIGRGAAFGDYDNDGDTDVLAVDLGDGVRLLRNMATEARRGHWLGVELAGPADGAVVRLERAQPPQVSLPGTGGGLYSANDPRVLFGLGDRTSVEAVSVRWPDGRTTRAPVEGVDRYVKIRRP